MSIVAREIHNRFERRIRLVINAGIALPPEYLALQDRLKSFRQTTGTPVRDRIVTALVAGDAKADLPGLLAAAMAEAQRDNELRNDTHDAIRDGVQERLRSIYNEHCIANYQQLAQMFDGYAAAFTDAANTVDLEAAPADVLDFPSKAQQAWKSGATHAAKLTELLPALRAAATLAGAGDDTNPDEALPLVVDPTGHDRTALWRAWDTAELEAEAARVLEAGAVMPRHLQGITSTNTGRWGALHKLGVTIATRPLHHFSPHSRSEAEVFAPNTVQSLTRTPDALLRSGM